MLILVRFRAMTTAEGGRRYAVASGFRPEWTSEKKPERNEGTLMLSSSQCTLGKRIVGVIYPVAPELWYRVKIGDTLQCCEGPKIVGDAIVDGVYTLTR
jgi:hypothetical protein